MAQGFPSIDKFGINDNPLVNTNFIADEDLLGAPFPGMQNFILLDGTDFLLLGIGNLLLLGT